MHITESMLDELRFAVRAQLSERRFTHTLGVERAAHRLAQILLPTCIPQLRAAALLHDITKEYGEEEHHALLRASGVRLPEELWHMPALLHSYTAPLVVRRDHPVYATEQILGAIACHTAGKADMSTFDKLLFIADYIEDGRTYASCVAVRDKLYAALRDGVLSPLEALDDAVLMSLEGTIAALSARAEAICSQTLLARNALLAARSHD